MRLLKNQKGITMIALTITIIVLMIITSITIVNMNGSLKMKKLNRLYDDISNLKTKIDTYYMEYKELPTKGQYCDKTALTSILTTNGATDVSLDANDGDNYYVIDLSKMEGVTLNYGREYSLWESGTTIQDLYIVNGQSHQIYYPKGIEFDNELYYSYFTSETNEVTTSTVSGNWENVGQYYKLGIQNISIVTGTKMNLSANIQIEGEESNLRSYSYQYAWSSNTESATNYRDFNLSIDGNNATASGLESEKIGGGNYYLFIKTIDALGNELEQCVNYDAENEIFIPDTITEKQIILRVLSNSASNGKVSVEVQFDSITLDNMKYGEGDSLEDARKNLATLNGLEDTDPSENVTKYTINNVNGEKYFYVQGKDTTNGKITSAYIYIFQQASSDNGTITAYNSMSNGLVDYKIYGNSIQSNLPQGYTQLEYIENTGTQYLNIGTIDMNNYKTKLEYTAQCLNGNYGSNQRVFAYGAVASNTNFTAWENTDRYFMSTLGIEQLIYSDSTTRKHTAIMERTSATSATFTVDNSQIGSSSGTFESSSRLAYVMGDPNYGQYYQGRIWSLKLWQDDVLTRNLIPCKDSSDVIGMYDTVTKTFYTNVGTGSFTGPIAVPSPDNPIEIQSAGDLVIEGDSDYAEHGGEYRIPVKVEGINKLSNSIFTSLPRTSFEQTEWRKLYAEYHLSSAKFKKNTYYTIIAKYTNINGGSAGLSLLKASEGYPNVTTFNKQGYTGLVFNTLENTDTLVQLATRNYSYATSGTSVKYENFMILEGDYRNIAIPNYEPYYKPATYNIYLDEPLRKVGNYADYIDLKEGKVVRNVYEANISDIFNNRTVTYNTIYRKFTNVIRFGYSLGGLGLKNAISYRAPMLCNILPAVNNGFTTDREIIFVHNYMVTHFYASYSKDRLGITDEDTNEQILQKQKDYIKNNNIIILYPPNTPSEKAITLPNIQLDQGTNNITVGTNIAPSKLEISYLGE